MSSLTAGLVRRRRPIARLGRGGALVRQWPAVDSLILVVAELLSVPRLVAATLVVALGGVTLLALGQVLVGTRLRTRALRWWRRLMWTAIGVFGLSLIGLLLIDLLLFAPALRIALDQIELRSGVDISFQHARGSLFTGRLELGEVTVRRASDGLEFTLTVRELTLDVDMLQLHRDALQLTLVRAVGIRGSLIRREGGPQPPVRPFVIGRLELEDVQIEFEDMITAPFRSLPLEFETLKIAPLRSELAMLDVLCGAEARGSARGYSFGAGAHAWQARGIPIGPAAHKLGAAGRWIRGGDLDLTLGCAGDYEGDEVRLEVDLRLHNFKIAPPGDSARHLPASRVAEALSGLGPELQLRFGFGLPRERFRGATNVDQLGLWDGAI
jgi:hypothetical protein